MSEFAVRNSLRVVLAVAVLIVMIGCGTDPKFSQGGGSGGGGGKSSNVTVSITPTSVNVDPTATQLFTATVGGTSNTAVTWSVSCSATSGSCGSVNTSGLYVAPPAVPSPNSITVKAVSQADTTKSAAASVAINSSFTQSTASISASPTSLSFGNVSAGTTATQTLVLTNSGSSGATVSAPTSCCGFVVQGTFPLTISAGTSASFTVAFAPPSTGTFFSTLSFASNATNSPTNVTASGSGVLPPPPGIAASPLSLSFPSIATGTSSTLNTTVNNTGGQTLTITAAPISGDPSFSVPIVFPVSINAGSSMSLPVKFAPNLGGTVTGSLSFTSNASNSTPVVSLSGSATAPTVTVAASPSTISFPATQVGGTTSQTVSLTNTGSSSVTISSFSSSLPFSVSGLTVPLTLAPTASATVTINFTPTLGGTTSGQVSFLSNATNSPANVSVSGSATHVANLSWTASTSQVQGYNVYRSTASGSGFVLLTTTPVPTSSYSDSTVQSGFTYYYIVKAVTSGFVESTASNQVTAPIPSP